jgi:type 1 glutamine amidotransferase
MTVSFTQKCAILACGVLLALAPFFTQINAQTPKFKVLCLAFPDNNHPGTDTAGANCIRRLAARDSFSVDVWTSLTNITGNNLAPYDLIIAVMAAPLSWSAANMTAFENYITGGKPWIGTHVAGLNGANVGMTWTWYESQFFGGADFKSHPATRQNGTVHVDAGALTHPITQGVPAQFTEYDEWWAFTINPRTIANTQILLTVDEKTYSTDGATMTPDHPIAWTMTKFGRSVYFSEGHPPSVYLDKNFQQLMENAILWAVNKPSAIALPSLSGAAANAVSQHSVKMDGGSLTIAMQKKTPFTVTIADASGRTIAQAHGINGVCRLDRQRLGNGVVFACVNYRGGTFTDRVVIDR